MLAPDLGLPDPRAGRDNLLLCISYPACDILLQQPEGTKTVMGKLNRGGNYILKVFDRIGEFSKFSKHGPVSSKGLW